MAFPSWPNKPKQHVMYNDDDDVMKVKDIDIDDETAGVCKFLYLFIIYCLVCLRKVRNLMDEFRFR